MFSPLRINAVSSLSPKHKLSEFAIVYIDDILVYSKPVAKRKQHLEVVLSELRKH